MSPGKTVKEVLVAARELLVNKGWHQGSYGKTAEDNIVESLAMLRSTPCVAYCATGAIYAAEGAISVKFDAETLLRRTTPKYSIVGFNDAPERTKEEVLQLFDQAIERAI